MGLRGMYRAECMKYTPGRRDVQEPFLGRQFRQKRNETSAGRRWNRNLPGAGVFRFHPHWEK